MIKFVPIIFLSLLFAGCNSEATSYKEPDSIGNQSAEEFKDSVMKSIKQETMDKALGDTTGSYKSPVKVIQAKMIQEEYSSFRDIELTFKNVSDKTINAIEFSWYGLTGFGEPAEMGSSLAEGYGGGFTDKTLKPGRTLSLQWSINSRNGKKVTKAWVTKVAFADGSRWELGK